MKLTTGLLLSFFFIFMACSDDDNDVDNVACGQNWFASETVQNALTTFTNAASAYGMNPTTENCNAYKNAADDYIDVLESFRSCAVDQGVLDEWEEDFD